MGSEIDVPWENIRATVVLDGGTDIGLENLGGEVTANVKLSGSVDAGLDNVRVKELPKIETDSTLRVSELPEIRTDSKVDLGLDDIRIRELPRVQLELGIRPFRLHLPVHLKFRLELLGIKLFEFSVCGEGMAIGEEYERKRTEGCE